MSYTRFDKSEGIAGKLEVWSLDKNKTRVEMSEPDRKGVYLLASSGRLRSKDSVHLPQDVASLLQDVLHPFPTPLVFEDERVADDTFGSVRTKCYLLNVPNVSRVARPDVGLVPTFCVDQNDILRVAWLQRGLKIVNEEAAEFEGHPVPRRITIFFGEHHMLDGKVDALSRWQGAVDVNAEDFVPDVFTGPVRVSGGVMQANRLTSVPPEYPISARRDHVAGTVTLTATISKDGRVGNLNVVSSPRADLSLAAMDAVRQWTYKPYQLNGVPVEVNTTMVVNFNLSR